MAPVVINTYCTDANLFVGGETIKSKEAKTQGEPLAMAMAIYSVVITPLIRRVNPLFRRVSCADNKQLWFADDASSGAKLPALRRWWDTLMREGPAFGYFVNGEKTWLVTKEEHFEEA